MVRDFDPADIGATTTETNTRFYINGTRLPVADVDVHIRKEGPLDVTRYVEAKFPSPYAGIDWIEAFNGVDPSEQSSPDVLRLDVKDYITDDYSITFRGVVTGVGSTANGGSRIWKTRAQGPGQLLDKIPASQNYNGADLSLILSDVADRLSEKLPFPVATRSDDVDVQGDPATPLTIPIVADLVNEIGVGQISTRKTFQANKHTLADVVRWARDKAGARIWLEPTPNGVALVGSKNPTADSSHHVAHNLGGDCIIISNDALAELRPINTIVVNGKAARSLAAVGDFEINASRSEFTTVKARHEPLYRRSGGTELRGSTVKQTDAESKTEVENEARSMLKERIDETTAGTIQTLPRSPIVPFDTVEAVPSCQNEVDQEPLTYEVQRVHHHLYANPSPDEQPYYTELNVGLKTDIEDDIEIVDSWEQQA
ncbi:hypothetical protein [Halobellus rubicundus]|uniref:Minor tail protein n=1 Tax=Halobellus rubicundus TaxID=2996466 RepID=A0ABD5MDL6_9EURY